MFLHVVSLEKKQVYGRCRLNQWRKWYIPSSSLAAAAAAPTADGQTQTHTHTYSRSELCTIMIKHSHATCTERDQLTCTYIKLRLCVSLVIKTYVFISSFFFYFSPLTKMKSSWRSHFFCLFCHIPIYNFFLSFTIFVIVAQLTRCRCRRNRKYIIRRKWVNDWTNENI